MKKNSIKILTIACLVVAICACTLTFAACDDKNTGKDTFAETTRFYVDNDTLKVMDLPLMAITAIEKIAIDMDKTYFEFNPDGTMHMQITTKEGLFKDVQGLLDEMKIDLTQALETFDINGSVNGYVEPMFPGFDDRLSNGDLKGALALIERSLGFNITGLDYEDQGVKDALAYIANNRKLPADLLSKIPADTVLQLTLDQTYGLRKLKGADGKEYTAIYIGALKDNDKTAPFGVFTLTEKDGVKSAVLRIEFMNIQVGVKTR